MMNMIPQNDNFILFGSDRVLRSDDKNNNQNPPQEVPGQDQTPEKIPEKSIN